MHVLDEFVLVIDRGIVLLDRVKEAVFVELSLQLQEHQLVPRFSRITHLVQVEVNLGKGCMLLRLTTIRKVPLMYHLYVTCL